jgi:O-antigen ligase/tetratricopeptide (TPR) repeat protein
MRLLDKAWPIAGLLLFADVLLSLLIIAAPWPYACTPEWAKSLLIGICGIAFTLVALTFILGRSISWRPCAIQSFLLLYWLIIGAHLIPLPESVRGILQPFGATMQKELLPESLEQLPGEPTPQARSSWRPLSVQPETTQNLFIDVTTLAVLFIIVRQGWLQQHAFRRIAWLLVLNSAAIAAFGLLLKYSIQPGGMLSWTKMESGFATIPNRNHSVDLMMIGLGLGIGLWRRPRSGNNKSEEEFTFWDFFQDPLRIGLSLALLLILIGILLSGSRGGLLSVISAGFLTTYVSRKSHQASWAIWLIGLLCLLPILAFLPVADRFETLTQESGLKSSRGEHFQETLSLSAKFAITGSGPGTYAIAEPLIRTMPLSAKWDVPNAHNEYLNALAEGGILWLFAILGLLYCFFRQMRSAIPKFAHRSRGPLLVGGFLGIVGIALHGLVEFGTQIPAIAFWVIILLAHLLRETDREEPVPIPSFVSRPLGIFICCLTGMLILHADRQYRADRFRTAVRVQPITLEGIEQSLQLQRVVMAIRPNSGQAQAEMAQLYLEKAALYPQDAPELPVILRQSIFHWRQARELAPYLRVSHLQLGLHADLFEHADSPETYFIRARKLHQTDGVSSLFLGNEFAKQGLLPKAMEAWADAIEREGSLIGRVVDSARAYLPPQKIAAEILMGRSDRIAAQMDRLAVNHPDRIIYLRVAREMSSESIPPKEALRWARFEKELDDQPARVKSLYQQAIDQPETPNPVRLEYARYLDWIGEPEAAKLQLESFFRYSPDDNAGRELQRIIDRELKLRSAGDSK